MVVEGERMALFCVGLFFPPPRDRPKSSTESAAGWEKDRCIETAVEEHELPS